MSSRTSYWLSALGLISVIAFLFFNLEWFPGLHGDEAWVGLYAARVKASGLYTPHLMNTYTGAMFGWTVYYLIEIFGSSVFTLRLMGAVLNSIAAMGFVVWAGRRFGPRGALAMAGLLASSGMFLVFGRVAWEVCVFQNLLILAILWSCRPFVEEGRFPVLRLLVFFSAIEFGILNHFIFLSVPLSLGVYSAAAGTLLKDRRAARLRPLFFLSLLMGVVCYCKQFVTPEIFVAYRPLFLGIFFAMPFLFTALFQWLQPRFPRLDFLDALWPRRAMLFVVVAGMLSFCVWHLAPMIQIISGVALMRRVVSLDPVWPVRWLLYGWGLGWFALYFFRVGKIIRSPSRAVEGAYAQFVLLWVGAYLAVFILMRHTSSIRYYILMHALVLAAFTVSAAKSRFFSVGRNAVLTGLVVAGLNGFYWNELVTTPIRRPLKFRVGFRREKSIDFIDKRALFERIDRERVCRFDDSKQDFLYIPAYFYRNGHPVDCDPAKSIALTFCWECERPPFYSYVSVEKN